MVSAAAAAAGDGGARTEAAGGVVVGHHCVERDRIAAMSRLYLLHGLSSTLQHIRLHRPPRRRLPRQTKQGGRPLNWAHSMGP